VKPSVDWNGRGRAEIGIDVTVYEIVDPDPKLVGADLNQGNIPKATRRTGRGVISAKVQEIPSSTGDPSRRNVVPRAIVGARGERALSHTACLISWVSRVAVGRVGRGKVSRVNGRGHYLGRGRARV